MRKQQTFAVTQAEYCIIWKVAALTAAGKEYKMLKDQLEKSLQILALEAQVSKFQAEQGYSVTELDSDSMKGRKRPVSATCSTTQ